MSETFFVDFLVVGSGAGGMTAAIRAHDLGLNTLVVEKTDYFGGTSAMSGGSVWIPNNHQQSRYHIADSREQAIDYLKALTKGTVDAARIEAYVDKAPEMLRYLEERGDLECELVETYADYYPDQPGALAGGRTLEAKRFNALKLGEFYKTMRSPHPACITFGIMFMTARDAYYSVRGDMRGYASLMKAFAVWLACLPLRLYSKRSVRVTLGNGLVAPLRVGLKKRNVPVWLNSPLEEVIVEEGRVVGAWVNKDGKRVQVRAKKGVCIAAGGFEHNRELREQYLPKPTDTAWACGNPANTGDWLAATAAVKPALDFMHEAWWTPATVVPGSTTAHALVYEKGMPHSMFVDSQGKRFTNEAAPYIDVVNGMYQNHVEGERRSVPCWLVFDSNFRKNTAVAGAFYPTSMMPDAVVPKKLWNRLLFKAPTLTELAHKIGVNAQNLQETVRHFNRLAKNGVDEDFGRGGNVSDNYYSRPQGLANGNLGSLEAGPFYAVPVVAGDLGTKGGLLTNARAQVLNQSGQPIAGLYACGNCSSAVMGPSYAGAGSTLGPAMTFGYVAAETAAAE